MEGVGRWAEAFREFGRGHLAPVAALFANAPNQSLGQNAFHAGGDQKRMAGVERRLADAVRGLQRGAVRLRGAWAAAGKEELARRAARDGGREGGHHGCAVVVIPWPCRVVETPAGQAGVPSCGTSVQARSC